jgi:hypothetical protein
MTNLFPLTSNSVYALIRHCEERSLLGTNSKRSQGHLNNKLATKQSPFTQQLTRAFQQLQNLFTTNSEQGDCFADSATTNVINSKSFTTLRLAMTDVGEV